MLTRKSLPYGFLATATAASVLALCAPAKAEHLLYSNGPFSLSWLANAGGGGFVVPNANFGYGSKQATGTLYSTAAWAEGWLKPEVKGNYHSKSAGTFYFDVSVIGAQTLGKGDANAITATPNNPTGVGVEEAYLGWTGDLPTQTGDTLTVQLGRQNFSIDDGFLMADGNLDTGSKAAFYTAPRTAFDGYGVIKVNSNPVRADFFVLRNTTNKHVYGDVASVTFAGFDAQWFKDAPASGADGSANYADRYRYLGVTAFKIFKGSVADSAATSPRAGMNVASASFGGHWLPVNALGLSSNFTLYGQYVWEFRKSGETSSGTSLAAMNANAYYIEPGYTFNGVPWTPKVYYRYSHFSGNNPASTSGTKTGYDPLFYATGIRSSFGTYFMGEIVGLYNLFNTNENVHQVGFAVSPPIHIFDKGDSTTVDLNLYNFALDQPIASGGAKEFAKEADLVVEYQYNAATYVAVMGGVAIPQSASTDGINVGGSPLRKPTAIVEAYFTYAF